MSPQVSESSGSGAVPSEVESADALVVRAAVLDAAQKLEDEENTRAQIPTRTASGDRISSTVDVPGKGPVYKMRLVTELNQSPGSLPLDRLRRVQVRKSAAPVGVLSNGTEEIGLFDNVAVHLEEGEDRHAWYVGRVQKMFKQYAGGFPSSSLFERLLLLVTCMKIFVTNCALGCSFVKLIYDFC